MERVESGFASIEDYLLSRPEVTHVTTSVGLGLRRYNLVRSIAEPTMSYGELIVDYTTPEELKASMTEIQDYLTAHYPDAYVRMKRYNLMYKKYPIELMFTGPDPAVLRELTEKAEQIMRDEPAITLVTNDWEPMTPTLMVDYYQRLPVPWDFPVRMSVCQCLLPRWNARGIFLRGSSCKAFVHEERE